MLPRLGLVAFLASSFLVACDGPSAASVVEGELICPDFQLGAAHTKMHGGLRQPIQMKVMNGRTVIAQLILTGQPSPTSEPTRFLLPDGNNEYSVEWAQCPNERATTPADVGARKGSDATHYICGDTKPYKTEKLVTKRGDASSRKVTVPAPPTTTCWTDETPDPVVSASTSAEPVPSAVPSAEASAAAAPSASAPPSASAAPSAAPSASTAHSASAAPSARPPQK